MAILANVVRELLENRKERDRLKSHDYEGILQWRAGDVALPWHER